jgi:outer membrane lipoprotein-sorting protein
MSVVKAESFYKHPTIFYGVIFMNKFLRFGLTALTLMFVFSLFAAEIKAQGVLNDILKRMDDHNKALTSLQADVKMSKYNSQLDVNDITSGTAKYLPLKNRDALVRIDWSSPVQESLAVVNKEYVLFRPRLNQYIAGKVDNAKSSGKGANNALAFMNMSKQQLKTNYTVKYLGEEKVSGNIPTWRLELTPKNKTSYKVAELWVDGNGMPIQTRVVENNNDTTTILLSNMQKNVTLKADVFRINVKGARRIEG